MSRYIVGHEAFNQPDPVMPVAASEPGDAQPSGMDINTGFDAAGILDDAQPTPSVDRHII